MLRRKKEGHPLPETAEMKAWKKEFEHMSLSEHEEKLRSLGLDDEDLEEFKESLKQTKKPQNDSDK